MSNLPPPTEVVPTDGGGVFCRHCGEEMDPNLTVCPNCGTPRAGVEETIVRQAPVAATTRRTTVDEGYAGEAVVADPFWSPQMMGLAALVLVILVVVLFVALGRSNDATTTTTTTTATTATTVTQTSIVVVPGAPAPQAPIIIQQPPAQTAPPQTSPPQTSPPQTAPPTTQATTTTTSTTTAPPP